MIRAVALAVSLAAAAAPARAHPHVWIDVTTEILAAPAGGMAGLRLTFVFDELYSASLREQVRSRGDRLSAAEIETLRRENFEMAASYDYFTFLRQGAERPRVREVRDFTASFRGGRAVFAFTVPFVAQPGEPFEIATYDPEFYIAFKPVGAPPSLAGRIACDERRFGYLCRFAGD